MANTQNGLQNYLNNNEIYKSKKALLDENFKSQTAVNDQMKKDSQQAAAIAHQKLLKYLPEYNASMGLYGNGASETALLEANARYRSQQGQIAADHSARQASLLQNYNLNKLDLYSEAQSKYESEQASNYELAKDTITNWTGSSAELDGYINSLEGKVSSAQLGNLRNYYNDAYEIAVEDEKAQAEIGKYQTQDISAAGDIDVKDLTEYSKGKNFTVKVGNDDYNVQIGEEVTTGAAKKAAVNSNVGDGEVFAYGNELYIKSGESVYRVDERVWGDKYTDLKKALGLIQSDTAQTNNANADIEKLKKMSFAGS